MGKKRNKKNSNKVSSTVHVTASGISIQHVSKDKLDKSKTKKNAADHDTQDKSSNKSSKADENEFDSEIEQSISSLKVDDKKANKSTDKNESWHKCTADTTVAVLSEEHYEDAIHKKENEGFVAISKNKSVSNKKYEGKRPYFDNSSQDDNWDSSPQHFVSPDRTDGSKNWRIKEESNRKKYTEKNYQGGSSNKRDINDEKMDRHRSTSRGDRRNEQFNTRKSDFSDEDEFVSNNDRAYNKNKYSKSKDNQMSKNQDNYNDNHQGEFGRTIDESRERNRKQYTEKNYHGGNSSKRDNYNDSRHGEFRKIKEGSGERNRKEYTEKNYHGVNSNKKDNNEKIDRHRSTSRGDRRKEQFNTRNSDFSDEDDFVSFKSDRAYNKNKYSKSKDNQMNKNRDNYNDNRHGEFESSQISSKSLRLSHFQNLENFVDDAKFHLWLRENKDKFNCVSEIEGDLFDASEDTCLAHCVAEDMSMGSGIAVTFRKQFKKVAELLDQRQRCGGLAILEDKKRFIYYLVTKKYSRGKPTLSSLWASLNKLKDHMVENNGTALAIPRIGCGLDRLEWCEVKPMIEYLFSKTGITVTVYNLPKQSDLEDTSTKQVVKNCKVVTENYSLIKIEEYTIIVYFCSEEGEITEQIKTLDKKFNILSSYNNARKKVGSVIRHDKRNYIIYGFVVKTKPTDDISFQGLQKCIHELNLQNKKDCYNYVAIEEFSDPRDGIIFDKVINLMRNGLRSVDVYVCQPHKED